MRENKAVFDRRYEVSVEVELGKKGKVRRAQLKVQVSPSQPKSALVSSSMS